MAINSSTDSGDVNNSILKFNFKRFVINLYLPKEQKQAKTAISRKN